MLLFHQEQVAASNSSGAASAAAWLAIASTTQPATQPDGYTSKQLELDAAQVLLVGLLISLIVISVVGNCLVCVAIFTDRRLRKLGNAFIVSLAIADLFVSCLVMTFALCNDLMNQWIFGDWFCDVWISFDIMCCTASILNLCAISLDRFIHIKDCLLYNQWMTRRVALSAVIIIWFISALVSFVPINLGWHKPPTGASSYVQRGPGSGLVSSPAPLEAQFDYEPPPAGSVSPRPLESLDTAAAADDDEGHLGRPQRRHNESLSDPGDAWRQNWRHHTDNDDNPNEPLERRQKSKKHDGFELAPQCMLSLTPTYAVISSTISFYIPCIIMLGLYTKLFACARKHVKSIQAISKAPAPLSAAASGQPEPRNQNQSHSNQASRKAAAEDHEESVQSSAGCQWQEASRRSKKRRRPRICGRAWLKFRPANQERQRQPRPQAIIVGKEQSARGEDTRPTAQAISDKLLHSAAAAASGQLLTKVPGGGAAGTTEPGGGRSISGPLDCQRQQSDVSNCSAPSLAASAAASAARGEQLRAANHEKQQLTQQLTLERIAPADSTPATRNNNNLAGAACELCEQSEQSRPFLGCRSASHSCPSQQQQQQSSTTTTTTTLAGELQRAGSWRQQLEQRLKREHLRPNSASFNLRQQQQQQQQQASQQQQRQQQQQRGQQLATHKAAVTLGIIMGTFLFCWVPFFCLNIIKAFCVDCIPSSLFRAFTWLGYANSALNPIIYGIHNSEFRHAFNRIFFKHLNIKNSRYYLNRRFSAAYDMRHNHHRQQLNLQREQQFRRRRQSFDNPDSGASFNNAPAAAAAAADNNNSNSNSNNIG